MLTYYNYHFKLDILEPNVLIGPWFYTDINEFDQELKGEMCNFLHLDQPEITIDNMRSIIGEIVLYQYPSKFDSNYHLRFVRILSIDKLNCNMFLSSELISPNNKMCEKIINLKQRSSAYRIWIPAKLYIDKIRDIII
jgi:hypothetical protein